MDQMRAQSIAGSGPIEQGSRQLELDLARLVERATSVGEQLDKAVVRINGHRPPDAARSGNMVATIPHQLTIKEQVQQLADRLGVIEERTASLTEYV